MVTIVANGEVNKMAGLMGERVEALVRGEWVQAFAVGFEKNGITITEEMLYDVAANAAWAGWAPRLILHHTDDDFELKNKDEVPALALLRVERRVEGENGKSSLWVRVDQWLTEDPEAALKGFVEFSPEVWLDDSEGSWFFPFLAALGGELPLQRGLKARRAREEARAAVFRVRNIKAAANETAPWDFADSDYSIEQLFRASAVVEGVSGNPHTASIPEDITKDRCHLRHHAPNGTIYLSGVNAARARLKQTNITDEEKTKADNHLLKHLKDDFGRDDAVSILGRKEPEEVNMTLFERIVARIGEAAAKLSGLGPVTDDDIAKIKASLVDTVAAQEQEGKIWSVLMAFDDAVANVMASEETDKTAKVKGLIAELGALLDKALAAKATNETPAPEAPEKVAGAAAAAPAPPAPAPEQSPAEDTALADLIGKVDALAQRVAAVEARLDDKVAAEPEANAAKACVGVWNAEELKANVASQLKARGVDYGKDPSEMDEKDLIALVERYAKENSLTFSKAYAKLVGQVN